MVSQVEAGHGCPIAIWEGSGDVVALADRRLDQAVDATREALAHMTDAEARRLVERMATTWAASLLVRHGHPAVADADVTSRLTGDRGAQLGTLPPGLDLATIAARVCPPS